MTILSKKKALQGKQQEVENAENTSHALPLSAIQNQISGDRVGGGRGGEERLGGSPGLLSAWPPSEPETGFDDFGPGPSHSKRRHRASPLRSVRAGWGTELESVTGALGGEGGPLGAGPSSASSESGYNSGDEYDLTHKTYRTEAQWIEEDRNFEKKMRKRGFLVKKMGEDGACLFRAVADQVYGDQEMHAVVRKHCMDYIALNSDYFSQYVTEDFNTYVNRKRQDCTHGNHIEMQAISEMYNRTIEVFCYGKDPINIFHGMQKSENEPIRLSYQRGSHYNSIIDPLKSNKGLPVLHPPPLAASQPPPEATLLKDAIRQSEEFHIEQAMLEDKLRATDWEATNEAIEEQVARDSYLQFLRDNEKRKRGEVESSNGGEVSPQPCSTAEEGGRSLQDPLLPPQLFGFTEWEDAGILAQVLAQSQQEYLDNLKKSWNHPTNELNKENISEPSTSR